MEGDSVTVGGVTYGIIALPSCLNGPGGAVLGRDDVLALLKGASRINRISQTCTLMIRRTHPERCRRVQVQPNVPDSLSLFVGGGLNAPLKWRSKEGMR